MVNNNVFRKETVKDLEQVTVCVGENHIVKFSGGDVADFSIGVAVQGNELYILTTEGKKYEFHNCSFELVWRNKEEL